MVEPSLPYEENSTLANTPDGLFTALWKRNRPPGGPWTVIGTTSVDTETVVHASLSRRAS